MNHQRRGGPAAQRHSRTRRSAHAPGVQLLRRVVQLPGDQVDHRLRVAALTLDVAPADQISDGPDATVDRLLQTLLDAAVGRCRWRCQFPQGVEDQLQADRSRAACQ